MCFACLPAQRRINLMEVTEIYVGRGGGVGWMNVGTLMWDQSLSSESTIFLLLCAGMQSICWKTQSSCKLIEGGDFLTVTLIKNKLLFEKTVHHPGTVLFQNYGTHAYSLTYFLKFSDGCQNRALVKYRLLNFTPNCLYYSLGTLKKHQEFSLVLLNVTQMHHTLIEYHYLDTVVK